MVVLLLLAASFSAEAQRAQVARIGIIQTGSPATSAGLVDGFSQRLRELGDVEGANVTIEVRYEATSTIPIVMVSAGDAVAAGLVRSLAQPGGNVTGQSFMGPELVVKGFDVLTEAFPRAKRIATLFNPGIARSGDPAAIRAVGVAAQTRGVGLLPVEFRHPDDLDRALAPPDKAWPDALLVFAVNVVQLGQVVEFAARHRLPAIYGVREAVEAGGLMSFGPKLPELWRGAANDVGRILKGARPGSLPVGQPTTLELVVDPKTAKTLGVIIPPALLARADQVIQ